MFLDYVNKDRRSQLLGKGKEVRIPGPRRKRRERVRKEKSEDMNTNEQVSACFHQLLIPKSLP